MKKSVFIIIALAVNLIVSAQDTTYYSVLRKGIAFSNLEYRQKNYQELANICERIISLKPDEWLPFYYGAYAYINMSFIEAEPDVKKEYCKKAKIYLEKAKDINPGNPEPDILEAMFCYAMMEITPMVNGPLYLPRSKKALETAKNKDPENPRIYYLEGKSTMYMPAFMGGGKDVAIPLFEKALDLFKRFKPESNVHPSWGKSDTEKLLQECKITAD
ncbi:MAG: hypothetical protein JXR31_05260 [Prolixibacteraceae bacterium]|nr:hypothetical protein [Prolixibacteraceae bacterium]MBN2773635.1 hypothetical protein [Prolixibacteraceae bacterium]